MSATARPTEPVTHQPDARGRFGRLDVVVNNAGYGHFGLVEELTEAEARAQLETNLFGALWITQAALPILNGLVGLVQGGGEAPLEVEEARSAAFMAICEVGKALHRGQPADALWGQAISAAQHWKSLAG